MEKEEVIVNNEEAKEEVINKQEDKINIPLKDLVEQEKEKYYLAKELAKQQSFNEELTKKFEELQNQIKELKETKINYVEAKEQAEQMKQSPANESWADFVKRVKYKNTRITKGILCSISFSMI